MMMMMIIISVVCVFLDQNILENMSYGWFHLATAKICWHWWKLQYCNRCHFLSHNKNFMKILCLFKGCVSTQIYNLRAKINFANMLKNVLKSGNLRDLWTIFNIFTNWLLLIREVDISRLGCFVSLHRRMRSWLTLGPLIFTC